MIAIGTRTGTGTRTGLAVALRATRSYPGFGMKRHAALVGLSQDHHHGLALARRCLALEVSWQEVAGIFAEELEPHFSIEERLLFPALGADPIVERALADHAELRRRVGVQGSLADFGRQLHDHIRFEERELFERAQEVMTGEQLDALLSAWPKSADRP